MKQEPPAPEIISSLQRWWPWLKHRAQNKAILCLLAIGLAIGAVWWNWPEIEQKPFVKDILAVLKPETALPVAKNGAYNVLLADLTGETDEQMVTNIADSVNGLEGVHAARLKRALAGDATPQTLSKARQYLRETGFDVLIWGQVIRHGDRSVPKLYLEHASAREEQRLARQGRYALTESTLELPELFWSDLRAILEIKIASDASVAYESGTYKSDRLRPVIEKIERLTSSNDFSRWSQDVRAAVWQSAADSYTVLGEQSGEGEWLHHAIVTYREVLDERTRERVPLDWAKTQANLGNALWTLGERESGTTRLDEAVAAYRAALEERTRERVPLKWATTQNNLGTALWTLGERESAIGLLNGARTAIQSAYAIYKAAGYAQHDDYFDDRLRSVEQVMRRIEERSATSERSSSH
jgi:tetratricopeptide (TPR) repeat protein